MTMIEQSLVSHLLDGMVTCRHCGTPLETDGGSSNQAPKYVCATKNKGCDTPDIDAEPFNRLVVRRVINAILDDKNSNQVSEIVREDAMEEGGEDVKAIFGLQSRLPALFHLHEGKPLFDSEGPPLTEAEKKGLQWTEAEYRERWGRAGPYVNAVENPRKVRQYSLNLDTYLRPSNISTTRSIMESAVTEILAGPGSATINYRLPLPPGGGNGARSSEQVQF